MNLGRWARALEGVLPGELGLLLPRKGCLLLKAALLVPLQDNQLSTARYPQMEDFKAVLGLSQAFLGPLLEC